VTVFTGWSRRRLRTEPAHVSPPASVSPSRSCDHTTYNVEPVAYCQRSTVLARSCRTAKASGALAGAVYGMNRSSYFAASGVALRARTLEYTPSLANGAT